MHRTARLAFCHLLLIKLAVLGRIQVDQLVMLSIAIYHLYTVVHVLCSVIATLVGGMV